MFSSARISSAFPAAIEIGVVMDRLINAEVLRTFACESLQRIGCPEADARDAANALIWASLRGVDTHGIRNLVPYYASQLRLGTINAKPSINVEHETNTSARMDGDSGLGLVNAAVGMRLAISKANSHGVGMVAIHNSHHLGAAGYYAQLALEYGMLGICTTGHFFASGHENAVAPVNGAMSMFSTNPISFAAPCSQNPPFILDMSTSAVTVNRIQAHDQTGKPIPVGWAKDASSRPTLDASAAKILYPLGGETLTGGHKGLGLSMMVSVLTGVLSGGWRQAIEDSQHDQSKPSHFLAAIQIDQFMPAAQFSKAMDAFVESIQGSPRINADEPIHYPGSQGYETEQHRRRDGIPVDQRLYDELNELADSLSIDITDW